MIVVVAEFGRDPVPMSVTVAVVVVVTHGDTEDVAEEGDTERFVTIEVCVLELCTIEGVLVVGLTEAALREDCAIDKALANTTAP